MHLQIVSDQISHNLSAALRQYIINQSGKSECRRLWEAATATAAAHKYPAKVHC